MCGIVGIHGLPSEVAKQTYFALFAVQHRGQESAGIATADGHDLHEHNGMGLVSRVFTEEDLEAMPGFISVGHCRYSTTGSSSRGEHPAHHPAAGRPGPPRRLHAASTPSAPSPWPTTATSSTPSSCAATRCSTITRAG